MHCSSQLCEFDGQSEQLQDQFTEDESKDRVKSRVKRIIDGNGRKRRIYSEIHHDPKQSNRRFRANDRERRRMNSLNGALQALKGCVPLYHGKKRMTKLQILQFACHYINDLSNILCSSTPTEEHTQQYQSMDFLMALMNEQSHRDMMDDSLPTCVNGLNITQRVDYINFHNTTNQSCDSNAIPSFQPVNEMYPVSNIPQLLMDTFY